MVDGSVIKVSSYEAHTGQRAPTKLAALIERILVRAREEEPEQPRWKVGCLLGMVGADVDVLDQGGKHKRYGTWRHSPDAETDLKEEELRSRTKENATPRAGRRCTTVELHEACGR